MCPPIPGPGLILIMNWFLVEFHTVVILYLVIGSEALASGPISLGAEGGITQGVSFEFFESFSVNLLTQYPLGKFQVFSKIAHHFDQNLLIGQFFQKTLRFFHKLLQNLIANCSLGFFNLPKGNSQLSSVFQQTLKELIE